MARDSIEGLLWQKLDGELDAEERRELEAYRAEHPDVGEQERAFRDFAALLAEAEEVEPPEALRGRIGWAIAASQPPASRSPQPRRWSVRYAYLAAGLVLGIVGYQLLSPGLFSGEPDPSQLYGTLSPAPGGHALVLDLEESRGRLVLSRHGTLLHGDLSLERQAEAELELIGAGLEGEQAVLRVAGAGRYSLAVSVTDLTAPVAIALSVGGETLIEKEVTPSQLPEIR